MKPDKAKEMRGIFLPVKTNDEQVRPKFFHNANTDEYYTWVPCLPTGRHQIIEN